MWGARNKTHWLPVERGANIEVRRVWRCAILAAGIIVPRDVALAQELSVVQPSPNSQPAGASAAQQAGVAGQLGVGPSASPPSGVAVSPSTLGGTPPVSVSPSALAPSGSVRFKLPTPPDVGSLAAAYKTCNVAQLQVIALQQCASAIQLFQSYNIPIYSAQISSYAVQLRALGDEINRAKVAGSLSAADYAQLAGAIAIELSRTMSSGYYMIPYAAFMAQAQRDLGIVKEQITYCSRTLRCG